MPCDQISTRLPKHTPPASPIDAPFRAILPRERRVQPLLGPSMALTPQFIASFNRFAAVTATAYGLNPTPNFKYSVKLNPEMKKSLAFCRRMDGRRNYLSRSNKQRMSLPKENRKKEATFPAANRGVSLMWII